MGKVLTFVGGCAIMVGSFKISFGFGLVILGVYLLLAGMIVSGIKAFNKAMQDEEKKHAA